MNLQIDSVEKNILIAALRLLESTSNDTVEAEKIYTLLCRVEALKPLERIALMNEEGDLFVDGEKMTPSELGF